MQTREDVAKEMKESGTNPENIGKEILKLENEIKDWASGKVSIKQARLNSGFTLDVVSEVTGISVKKLEWYEENPGEIEFDEATTLCKLYGVKFDEVRFKTDAVQEKNCSAIYPAARRMCFATSIKAKIANIMLGITDDCAYSDQHIIDDLIDILDAMENEEEIVINEITSALESVKSKNHLNLSLAGR